MNSHERDKHDLNKRNYQEGEEINYRVKEMELDEREKRIIRRKQIQ